MTLPPPPPVPERIVRPRKPADGFPRLVVAHVRDEIVYKEAENVTVSLDEWIQGLQEEPPSLVACQFSGKLLQRCHRVWGTHRRWQFKVAPIEEPVLGRDGKKNTSIRTVVGFFGFAGKVKGIAHRANQYYYPLDPLQFGRTSLTDLALTQPDCETGEVAGREQELATLYRWANEIRNFCLEFGLKPSTTRGGVAKQLLRDPRFYPAARRKVPRRTNDRGRDQLPGNHYELLASRERLYSAIYLDQVSSHHTIASSIPLPNSNSLNARGHFHSLMDAPWALPGSRRWETVTREHGLLYVKLRVNSGGPLDLLPPWAYRPSRSPDVLTKLSPAKARAHKNGEKLCYLWTNELRLLTRFRAEIVYIIAAWTTGEVDTGIQRFSSWSLEYLKTQPPHIRAWLKPTLLTAYGMLATRPRKPLAGWWQSDKGSKAFLPIGDGLLPVMIQEGKKEVEPTTNHVIQRGMIEAETRARSLELALDLQADGYKILCIYADAVLVEPDHRALPLLPAEWQPKAGLTFLRFMDETHFRSEEMVRLPGVHRDSPLRTNEPAWMKRARAKDLRPRAGSQMEATEPGGARPVDMVPSLVAIESERGSQDGESKADRVFSGTRYAEAVAEWGEHGRTEGEVRPASPGRGVPVGGPGAGVAQRRGLRDPGPLLGVGHSDIPF